MSTLWPFDYHFNISPPDEGSEFGILVTAFVSVIFPLVALSAAVQLFCWACCSQQKRSQSNGIDIGRLYSTPEGRLPRGSRIPMVDQSRRWMNQARHDYRAVINDLRAEEPAYEWACFKCHQASRGTNAQFRGRCFPKTNRTFCCCQAREQGHQPHIIFIYGFWNLVLDSIECHLLWRETATPKLAKAS